MKSTEAEVLGSPPTRLENPDDIFRKFGINPEPVSKNSSSGQTKISEAFDRRGIPTEDTSDKQNLNYNRKETQEFKSTCSLIGNKTQTQNCDGASTETPGKYVSVAENKPQVTNINTTTKDVIQNQGFVGEDGKSDELQTNITSPPPEVLSTRSINPERGICEGTTISAEDASGNNTTEPASVVDTETTPVMLKETYSTPGSSTSEFETISFTTTPPTTPADLWWGGSKKRKHGHHKGQKVARLLEMASKGKSIVSNRRNDRRRRFK
jgi:hypothetical protein